MMRTSPSERGYLACTLMSGGETGGVPSGRTVVANGEFTAVPTHLTFIHMIVISARDLTTTSRVKDEG